VGSGVVLTSENWDAPVPQLSFTPRGRQQEWENKVWEDWSKFSRLLFVAPGGIGKSSLMSMLAFTRWHRHQGRTLVTSNRDGLVHQTAHRIRTETGLDVDIEMGKYTASPYAPVVVGSVQTLCRHNRLLAYSDNHFQQVLSDESHFALSEGQQRVLNFFHFGAESLADGWEYSPERIYTPKAAICGFTATPDIGPKRSLMDYFQHLTVNYSYIEAVDEGWLVPVIQKCIPVKIDLRRLKITHGPTGSDFKSADLSAALIPIIEKLADQVVAEASDRKTMCFLPSVECSRMLSDALNRRGLWSTFVSGECVDGDEKTEAFRARGRGSVLCNAQIYNFGIDFPDVDCVGWFRATISRAFYIQGVYRASRVLKGVIDGIEDAAARRMAIAMSAKPNMLILDPLFVSDRIDLCDAYHLFSEKQEVRDNMKKAGDLSAQGAKEAEKKAERDFLLSLKKAAKKVENRESRAYNPLAWAVSLGDEKLATWKPENDREARPPTPGQHDLLRRFGIDMDKIKYFGLAQKIITIVLHRKELGLASPGQLNFLSHFGISDEQTALLKAHEAEALLNELKKGHRPATPTTTPTPQSAPLPAPSIPLGIVTEEW